MMLDMMGEEYLCGTTIICLANAEWNSASRINCHHIMSRFASDNQVLFVESIGGRKPSPVSGRDLSKVFRRMRYATRGLRKPLPNLNLLVLSPLAIPGFTNPVMEWLNTQLLHRQIMSATRWLANHTVILWVFTPVFASVVRQLTADLVIYQCIDEHSASPGAPREHVRTLEQQLMHDADLVITTSKSLFDAKREFNPATVCLQNVADASMFSKALNADLSIPDDLRALKKPVAGFIGNLSSYKVDFELVRGLAWHNPDWAFVLIGEIGIGESKTGIDVLTTLPNVVLLGPRPYEQLPAYVKGFDVCLIPFALNEVTENCFPMKFFEYMASGKPVVSTPLPNLQNYAEFCHLASGVEAFGAAMRQALAEDLTHGKIQARIALAMEHSWGLRIHQLSQIVHGTLEHKSRELRIRSAGVIKQ
jgi:glycosyltransferase involved in cell wall biosynthesis